jgi:glycosyltransferase involved in cell wall biosynthesis
VAHSCVRSWWSICRGAEPIPPKWDRYIENVGHGLSAADVWVAPSRAFRDEIEALYAPPRPGRVIHNGSDGGPAGEKERFILAAGRLWDEGKNIASLRTIASSLPWPVKLAGSDRCEFGALDSGGAVELLGDLPHPELLALMARAGIFVAPSRYEPFGLGVLEAATVGCALVLADIPSFRELWDGAAIFVDLRGRNALRKALQQLCTDNSSRQELQRAAAVRARRYRLSAMVDRYQMLYDELADRTRSPRRMPALSLAEAPA